MQAIALRNAYLHAAIVPAAGGGLARLDWVANGGKLPVLRPFDVVPGDPPPTTSQLACFALVPWSNRIGGGGFTFEGRHVALAPNRTGEPCPIHGNGWQHPWRVQNERTDAVTLVLDRQDGQPFSYRALLRYELVEAALQVTLEVTNCGQCALPFGLGLHPWLERSAGVMLRARAGGVWSRGPDALPVAHAVVPDKWDLATLRGLPIDAVDNLFTGWDGSAEVYWPETGVVLDIAAEMDYFILYAPAGAGFFCFEPVDHAINAHNLPGGAAANGLTVLAPGQTLQRRVTFTVTRRAAEGKSGE